jgi:hypothetical protein
MVALANAALARAGGGTFVLRIDDTDQARSNIQDTLDLMWQLRWLGLEWDEGPIHQRDRADVHRAALERLIASGDTTDDAAIWTGRSPTHPWPRAHHTCFASRFPTHATWSWRTSCMAGS